MATIEDVQAWYTRDLGKYAPFYESVSHLLTRAEPIVLEGKYIGLDEFHLRFNFFTDANCYSISAVDRRDGKGYLGCTSRSRKSRAGEDWCRGSDLADGPLSEETWRRILADIVSYELVRVSKEARKTRRPEQYGQQVAEDQSIPPKCSDELLAAAPRAVIGNI